MDYSRRAQDAAPVVTARLALVPATPALTRSAMAGADALGAALGAAVAAGWPPEFLDAASLQFTLDRLAGAPGQAGWWLHFVLLREPASRTLVGSAGYAGPPSADGTVEIGYGIVREHQRRGYASEAARGLVARAFEFPAVTRVIAETYPELLPSIGVLHACGFRAIGDGSGPRVIRFELTRAEHEHARGPSSRPS